MASGGSSQVVSVDRCPSCNPALPTNACWCSVRLPPGTKPVTPGTNHVYPPAPLIPFASAKGWVVVQRAWLRKGSEARGWQVRTLAGHSHEVLSVAISTDGKRVVSGSADKTVKIWDVETGAEVRAVRWGGGVRVGGGGGNLSAFQGPEQFRDSPLRSSRSHLYWLVLLLPFLGK